jgi:tetratricopeptide (TPR) repeat protein
MDATRRGRALVLAGWASRSSPNAPSASVVQLEAALEALPASDRVTRAEAERELGRAHQRLGNRDDARAHLEKSLALVAPKEPDSAPALASLIVLYLDGGDRSAAARWAKKAGPTDDPDLLAALARVAEAAGDEKRAAEYRDRARAVAFLP